MKNSKKIILLILSFLSIKLFAFTSKDIRFLSFENGMKMYLIEDTSSALVRIEIRLDAGYSSQNETNAGYFPLYARLKNAVIDSDGVSKIKVCAPSDAEKSIAELSELLTPLEISDKDLRTEISIEKENTKKYANDVSGFINSAIEAKIFPSNPWKRESSVNPEIFVQNSLAESRSILKKIATDFYTPQNTTIFINGNITAIAAETFINRYFNKFSSSKVERTTSDLENLIQKEIDEKKFEQKKRFILTDKEFSDEMSQIVIQYTNLGQFECDIASTTMNEEFSDFKRNLSEDKNLGIRGSEYINVASIQKSDSSRLVIQSLLEKTKTIPPEQIKFFLEKTKGELFTKSALDYEINQYTSEFIKRCDSSTEIMQILATWNSLRKDDSPEKTLFNRIEMLQKIDAKELSDKISDERPFIFVLLNPKVYSKYEREFKKLGFTQITNQNGAWFNQEYYKNLIKTKNSKGNVATEEEIDKKTEEDTFESAKRFVQRNKSDFTTLKLTNKIPVVMKNMNTKTATLSITIKGGDILFAEKTPGLTTVLIDAIALNIRNQLDILHFKGYTKGIYSVNAKTENTYSVINVNFACDELKQTLNAIVGAIIYADITPALADGISYDERTQWRLKIGTLDFQMLSFAIKNLYKKQNLSLLYDDSKDKPKQFLYSEITENYPVFLDSTRYSLIFAGNFGTSLLEIEEFKDVLDSTFGSLGTNKLTEFKETKIEEPNFDEFEKRIKLKHLFLTDIDADKAGPMPAVLIPTTKFLDPILYILKSPDFSSSEYAIFNSLLLEFTKLMEEKAQKIEKSTKVKFFEADKNLPFARILITNVEKTNLIDDLFKESIEELKNKLSKKQKTEISEETEEENPQIEIETELEEKIDEKSFLQKMENAWILQNLKESETSQGTATLIQKSVQLDNPLLYLENYETIDSATIEDYFSVFSKYLDKLPSIRIYSVDSKK